MTFIHQIRIFTWVSWLCPCVQAQSGRSSRYFFWLFLFASCWALKFIWVAEIARVCFCRWIYLAQVHVLKNILMVNQSVLPRIWEVDVHIFHMSVQEFVRFAICKCILVVYQRIERQVSNDYQGKKTNLNREVTRLPRVLCHVLVS